MTPYFIEIPNIQLEGLRQTASSDCWLTCGRTQHGLASSQAQSVPSHSVRQQLQRRAFMEVPAAAGQMYAGDQLTIFLVWLTDLVASG